MNEETARKIAEPTVKEVVNCIAEKRYDDISKYAVLKFLSKDELRECIEGYLELNEFENIDRYGVNCNYKPKHEYHQLSCYVYNNGTGFHMDYDLTTQGELNDLTLQMEFLFTESDSMKAIILDVHVM